MKRTKKEIQDDLNTLKETLSVVEGEEKKMIEEGIADLEKELAEHKEPEAPKKEKKKVLGKSLKKTIEEQETDKPEPKYKVGDKVYTYWDESGISSSKTKDGEHAFKKEGKVEKTRWDKDRNVNYYTVTYKDGVFITEETDLILSIPAKEYVKGSNRHPERNKFHVDLTRKRNPVGHFHTLVKHSDTEYMLVRKKGDKEIVDFELVKRNGKWVADCKVAKKASFNTLQALVNYIGITIYNNEVKPILAEKRKQAEKAAEWRKNNPEGSPAKRDIKKGVTKAVDKIKEKADEGHSVTGDINAAFETLSKGLSELKKTAKEEKAKIEKSTVKKMIADLQDLYDSL